MEARQPSGRQVGGGDAAITTRIGAVVLLLGIIVILVAEFFHPAREHPMDNLAVFREYAHSNIWTAVHLARDGGGVAQGGHRTPAAESPLRPGEALRPRRPGSPDARRARRGA
jgi:hypothetical protein